MKNKTIKPIPELGDKVLTTEEARAEFEGHVPPEKPDETESISQDGLVDVGDVCCRGHAGNPIEIWDNVLYTLGVIRNSNKEKVEVNSLDEASLYLKNRGMYLPSLAVTCNVLVDLYKKGGVPVVERIMSVTDPILPIIQNTAIVSSEYLVHSGNIKAKRFTHRNEKMDECIGYDSIGNVLQDREKSKFLSLLTGLQNLRELSEMAVSINKDVYFNLSNSEDSVLAIRLAPDYLTIETMSRGPFCMHGFKQNE